MSTQASLSLDAELELTDWQEGPPPSVGWWPASRYKNTKVRRWWNGRCWSHPASVGSSTEKQCDLFKSRVTGYPGVIYWCGLKQPHPAGYSYELIPTKKAAA